MPGESLGYTGLAPWYDRLMGHVDYRNWAGYLRRLMVHHGHRPQHLLELAAGTCRMAPHLGIAGCKVFLTDLSPRMLEGAPWPYSGPRAAADARAIPFRDGSFDTVLMCYDAFDYLLTDEDALAMLDGCHRVLRPGGVLLFDTTTEANSRRYFLDGSDVLEDAGGMLVRRWWYDELEGIQNNRFDLFEPMQGRSGFHRTVEHHKQYIRSQEEVASLLGEANFRLEACCSGFGFVPAGPASERIHYLARRP